MIIPVQQLSAEAVQGLIEEFITREGTDYGAVEFSLSDKVEQIRAQLISGEVVVVFDTVSESVSIQSQRDAYKNEREYQQSLNNDGGCEEYFGGSSKGFKQGVDEDLNQDYFQDDDFNGV